MRIAIEARALSARYGGVATYVSHLVRGLAEVAEQDTYHVLLDTPSGVLPARAEVHVVRRSQLGGLPWWLHWRVPRVLRSIQPNVVHFTKVDVPITSRRAAYKTVVTVYDIIPLLLPGSQSRWRRWYWPGAIKRAVTLSHHVLTISEASKRDIVDRFHVPGERVTVTPLAVDTVRFRPTDTRLFDIPYILFVGRRDVRKNVAGLVRAFAQIAADVPHRLVIAGQLVEPSDGAEAEVSRLGLEKRVVWRASVSADELPTLLSGADVFVWPSVYEGWGLPPHEAMGCGTPVIVSDGGALPEVVGEAGVVVPFAESDLAARLHDAVFEQRLAAALGEILADAAQRQQLRKQGLERVQSYTWRDVARATQRVYNLVGRA